jgi:hypothetical protein
LKSQNNCFSMWTEKQWYSPDWCKVNQAAHNSRVSTGTVEAQRAKGNNSGTFHGLSAKADLLIKQYHGGAFTRAKAKK